LRAAPLYSIRFRNEYITCIYNNLGHVQRLSDQRHWFSQTEYTYAPYSQTTSEQDLWEENNPEEADFIANLIKDSYGAGLTPADVAVITPFRRQVRLIRETVKNKIESDLLHIIDL